MKTTLFFIGFGISVIFISLFSLNDVHAQDIPLDPTYCGGDNNNDYYVIPGEQICSRSPNACGNGYDEINTADKMPNAQQCMGDGDAERAEKGCAGYVPACCYEMARTGDYTKCIGYWERNWCAPSQCDEARTKGASDSQCGGNCSCSHAFSYYCGDKEPIPLAQRLGLAAATNTPAPVLTNSPTPFPTVTPIPPTPTSVPFTPTPTVALSCDQRKLTGDYTCDDSINSVDFDTWKSDYTNGQVALAYFEYWRRASY